MTKELLLDILTHGLLGAISADLMRNRATSRGCAAVIGGVSSLLPDLDVLIRSERDPLLVLEYHRHFSHSLLFAPLAAALGALLLWPLFRHRLSLGSVYWLSLVGYTSACLLDACTSYGTRLFWPLLPEPIALNVIAVVDPVFTLLLFVGAVLALKQIRLAWLAPLGALLYLSFGFLQQHRAQQQATFWAQDQQLAARQILAKPTIGNLFLWRTLVVSNGQIHARGFWISPFGTSVAYAGETAALVDPLQRNDLPQSSRAYQDLQRFHRLSEGLLVVDPHSPGRVGDARYAMLPTSLDPLWGIEINVQEPDGPTIFFTERDRSPAMRAHFLRMLLGRP